jgi:hypothetical protein
LKLKKTFDYTPPKEEEDAIEPDKLDGANLVLAVEDIKAATGGRLKFKGNMGRNSVPKPALRGNGAAGVTAKTQTVGEPSAVGAICSAVTARAHSRRWLGLYFLTAIGS